MSVSPFNQRLSARTFGHLLTTLGGRGLAAMGGVALSLVVARNSGVELLGAFTFTLAVTQGAAVFCRLGLDITLLKKTAALDEGYSALPWLQRYNTVGFTLAILVAAALACLIFFLPVISGDAGSQRLQSLLFCLPVLPAMTVVMLLTGYLKGRKHPALAAVLETGGVAGMTALVIWIGLYLFGPVKISQIILIYCLIYWGLLIVLFKSVLRSESQNALPELNGPVPIFTSETRHLYVISLAVFFSQPGALAIGGLVLNDTDLGLLRIVERYALVISFFLSAVDPVFAPYVVRAAGDATRLRQLFLKASALAGLPALFVALLLLWQSDYALSLAGPEALDASRLLTVLVLANVINAFTGGASLFLSLSGQEKYVMQVTLVTFAIALIGYLIGGATFGAMGFACAYSFVLMLKNGILVVRLISRK